jgi:hypothetical protein
MSPSFIGGDYRLNRKSYNLDSVDMSFPNRVLVAKHGLHQRGCGARVIARAWRGADMLNPTMIVNAVRREGVRSLGPSIPSGAQAA